MLKTTDEHMLLPCEITCIASFFGGLGLFEFYLHI